MGPVEACTDCRRPAGALLLAAVCAVVSSADDLETPRETWSIEGDIVGADGAGVWLGVVGDDPEQTTWTHVEGASFEVSSPAGEQVSVVALARNRVPLVKAVSPGEIDRLEIALSPGLSLDGTVRAEDGRPLGGVDVRVAAADAVVLDSAGRTGYSFPLRDAQLEVSLGNEKVVEVPPFARSKYTTTGDGKFRVGGLARGRHFLEAKAPGFVPTFRSHVGVRERTVNQVEVEMLEASHVWGRVVDGDGEPVVGAKVRADWQGPSRRLSAEDAAMGGHRHVRRRATARSAADGSFSLAPLGAGPLLVIRAESPEFGSSRDIIVHAPYDGLVIELGRHVVRGRVVDAATGTPLEAFDVGHRRMSYAVYDRYPRVSRLGDGRFEMAVHPDTYLVHVNAPGRFPWFTRLFPGTGGEYDLGEVALERARSITGHVRDARSGEPVVGVRVHRSLAQYEERSVQLFVSGGRPTPPGAETGPDGAFALDGLPMSADLLEVSNREGSGAGRTVVLPPNVDYLDIVLAFDGVVAGTLALPDGTPAKGEVHLWQRVGGSWTSRWWPAPRRVGEDGVFRWTGLGDGEYRITARADVGVADPSRAFVLRDGLPVEDVHLVVEPGGRLRGAIAGLRRGEDVFVQVRRGDRRLVRTKNLDNGDYVLDGVPDGAVVTFQGPGGTFERSVDFAEGDGAGFDFDFSGNARLSGTVRAGGDPVGGMPLVVAPHDGGRPTARATTSELGRYAVQGMADGRYAVRTRTGHSFDVHVDGDAVLDIEIPAISLSGSVRDEQTGRLIGGAQVRLDPADDEASVHAVIGAMSASDGSFRFNGLPVNDYTIRVSHRDYADASRPMRIDGVEHVDFGLRRDNR